MRPAFDGRDRVVLGLRGVALCAGLSYAYLSLGSGHGRNLLLAAFGGFAAYSAALYLGGWRLLARRSPALFYRLASGLDLGFVILLMAATGGAASPFFRALYVWVSMLAFTFGRRAGTVSSALALAVFGGFHLAEGVLGDRWLFLVKSGGLLMHGPLIGYLADRERRRAEELRVAHEDLSRAHQRFVAEQAGLVQAEKLSAIGLLAAGVAHEINNPLQGVLGCVKTLRDRPMSDGRRKEYFETIADGLERIRFTVRSLLDFARQRPAAEVDVDLGEVTQAALRLLAPILRTHDIALRDEIGGVPIRVRGDRSQLMQALVNVLMNAAHAVPCGGEIAVSAVSDGARVGVRVQDSGPGIPADVLEHVCDPFFTTKPEGEGTGLGLSITLGIVRAHGGELRLESPHGAGAVVTVWLPPREEALHA